MTPSFLISIDTEGDNLWSWDGSSPIGTENALFLPRFQELCDSFGFKPTYLANWEMIQDDSFCESAREWVSDRRCEVGMHLHAWNSPPAYSLNVEKNTNPGLPYLIEYPVDVLEAKVTAMTEAIESCIGVRPVTHRAGRWAMDQRYFNALAANGYICDCSVTPHISWQTCPGLTKGVFGSDYTGEPETPRYVDCGVAGKILEVPLSVRVTRRFFIPAAPSIRLMAASIYRALRGRSIQLRPNGANWSELAAMVDIVHSENTPYLMFMLHSSELMPGGSPTFPDESSIEALYETLERLFALISKSFVGQTIGEFAASFDRTGGGRW